MLKPLVLCALVASCTVEIDARVIARGIVAGSREASGAVLCIVGIADVIDAMTNEIDPNQARHEDRIRLLYGRHSTPEPAIAEGICRLLKTSYVACIHERVARIMSWTGDLFEVDLTDIPVTNQKGAADALMAAVVDQFRHLHVAQPFDRHGTARMEAATGRRIARAGRRELRARIRD